MRLGADGRVRRKRNDTMPASFADLFANDCGIDSIPADASEYQSWRFAILPEDVAHLPAGFATVGAGAHPLIRGAGKQQADRGQEAARTLTRRSPTGVVVYADPKALEKAFNENVVGTAQGGMNYHDCRWPVVTTRTSRVMRAGSGRRERLHPSRPSRAPAPATFAASRGSRLS